MAFRFLFFLILISPHSWADDVDDVDAFLQRYPRDSDKVYAVAAMDFTSRPLEPYRDRVIAAATEDVFYGIQEDYLDRSRGVASVYLLAQLRVYDETIERRLCWFIAPFDRRTGLHLQQRIAALELLHSMGVTTTVGVRTLINSASEGPLQARVFALTLFSHLMERNRARFNRLISADELTEILGVLQATRTEVSLAIDRLATSEASGAQTRRERQQQYLADLDTSAAKIEFVTGRRTLSGPSDPIATPRESGALAPLPGMETVCRSSLLSGNPVVVAGALLVLENMPVLQLDTIEALIGVARNEEEPFAELRLQALALIENQARAHLARVFGNVQPPSSHGLDQIHICMKILFNTPNPP